MNLLIVLICLDAAAFLIYGVLCLGSTSLASEFARYGIANLRSLIGVLEIVGGAGLLVGLKWRPAMLMSAGGLGLLMLIAFGFRIRFKDGLVASAPSLLFALFNFYLLIRYVRD